MESASLHVYAARRTSLGAGPSYRWVAVEQNNTRRRYAAWYSREDLPVWRELTSRVYREADAVVAVSEGVKAGLASHYGIDAGAISVIPNHVSNDAVAAALPAGPGDPAIIAAGRLHYQKGFPALVRAYALIADAVEEDLVILGEGEDRKALEEEIRGLGLESRVHLPGFAEDLWSRLKVASCFVLSSRFEGLPLTLLEAMSAGCPVVAVDCDYGPGEIITDGVDGLLVSPGDSAALADAISRVLTDDVLRQRLSRNGRARAADFDVRVSTAQYEALLRRMAAG
jgi:glycosyltransferase involved in cell wall biosynthesis